MIVGRGVRRRAEQRVDDGVARARGLGDRPTTGTACTRVNAAAAAAALANRRERLEIETEYNDNIIIIATRR